MLTAIRLPARLWIPLGYSGKRRIYNRFTTYRGLSSTTVTPAKLQTVICAAAVQPRFKNEDSWENKDVQRNGFRDLMLREDLLSAVEDAGFVKPTEIQEKGIPPILKGQDVVLASHTGSGKTLAYLLPLVQRIKDQEVHEGGETRMKRPRALILGPTRELTDQILNVAKSLSHHVRFRSALLNAGGRIKTQKEKLAMPQDIVIATPAKLNEHIEAQNIFFGDVQCLILDEADTMFDAGFGPEVKRIVEILASKPIKCQFILIGATMGKGIKKMVEKTFKNIAIIQTSSLHKGVPGSKHSFQPTLPGVDRVTQLHQILAPDLRKFCKVMVFCNTMDSCRAIEHTLTELGVQTLCYHGDMPIDQRKETMRKFSGSTLDDGATGRVLVCTDLAARGLDITGRVDHVINFDFPRTSVDYIHRSGRTARAGAPGRVTSLLGGKDRILASRIDWAIKRNLPLDELSHLKDVIPPSMRVNSPEVKQTRKSQQSMKGLRGAARVTAMREQGKKATAQKLAARKNARKMAQSKKRSSAGNMRQR